MEGQMSSCLRSVDGISHPDWNEIAVYWPASDCTDIYLADDFDRDAFETKNHRELYEIIDPA